MASPCVLRVQAGCWEQATKVMRWLSAVGADPVAHIPVAAAVAAEVQALLQPLLSAAFPHGTTGRYALDTRVRLIFLSILLQISSIQQ
jgi:hypothetical protein